MTKAEEASVLWVLDWLEKKRSACPMSVTKVPLSKLDGWGVQPETGWVCHKSGGFFRVIGVSVRNALGREVESWTQPILEQTEPGILGVLVKRIGENDRYLLQAKAEPGNISLVQLAPTVQTTRSNLERLHGGKRPAFAEWFENPPRGNVLLSVFQSESGGRFFGKSNLNIVVRLPEEESPIISDDFLWLTLPEVKALLRKDNVVNAYARSVFSCL